MGVAVRERTEAAREASLLAMLGAQPSDAAVALELAQLYIEQGRPIDALHRLEISAIHSCADPEQQDEACRLLLQVGDFEAAVRQAARGLGLTANSQLLNHHERALRRLLEEAAVGVSPRLKRTYLKGLDRLRRGRPDAAASLFEKVVRSAPGYAPAWIGLRGAAEAQDGPAAGAAVGERWRAAAPAQAGEIAVAMARPLAANGLLFDPLLDARMATVREGLTPVDSVEALERGSGCVLTLDPGGVSTELQPVIATSSTTDPSVRFDTAEVFIAGLQNAALIGRGVILTEDNMVLRELHSANLEKYGARDLGDHAAFDPAAFQAGLCEVKVYDTPAFLMCGATDKSFGDWVINFVPRLAIARQAGLKCPVVVSAKAPAAFIELLHALGVADEDIIFHDRNGLSLFRKLYVPSWPMRDFLKPMAGLFDVYRDLALAPKEGPGRRIYLSREEVARRGMVNEPQVRQLFERHGFEVVHPQKVGLMRMREILADAEFIAAPYGSALLNLAFAGRKPVSIVCQPPHKPGFLDQLRLWQASMGLNFAYVLGMPVGDTSTISAKDAPWVAPLTELEHVVGKVLKGGPRPR